MLRAGFAESDLTPPIGQRMGRIFVNVLRGEGVQWPLKVRVAVFEEGDRRVCLAGMDQNSMPRAVALELREAISQATGIPMGQVTVCCSHTHNGPGMRRSRFEDEAVIWANVDRLRAGLAEASRRAVQALTPARLRAGRVDASGWNRNRRPLYRTEQGIEAGSNGPLDAPNFVRLEGPADPELMVVLAEGEDGRPLGGLVNYACHPTTMYNVPVWSADYVGPLTDALQARYGGVWVFLQGTSGNVAPFAADGGVARGVEMARRMGEALAERAVAAIEGAAPVAGTPLRTAQRVLDIPQRLATTEQVELAQWYLEHAKPGVDQVAFTRRIYGHTYTMYHNSPNFTEWFCREMIGMWEWQQRDGRRVVTEAVEVGAIRLGEVGLAFFPCEYFAEFGLRVKAESALAFTMPVELANGWHGYVPTLQGHANGGYEARLGFASRLAPNAGDLMCDAALEMLRGLGRE